MPRCFVTRSLPGSALDRLRSAHEVDVWPGDLPPAPEELRGRLDGADALLCTLSDRIDAAALDAAPGLRVIANYAVGSDNIDRDETAARGIAVGVTPGVLTEATADLAFALLLAAARRLPEAERAVHAGAWRTWEPQGWLGLELHGATLAVVGFGRIGQAVARRAEAFGMEVLPVTRDTPLEDALARADAVTLHTPLTPETRHLVGERALRAMKKDAILVNTGRGALVDTDALCTALHAGEIGAAALDVTDPEPLPADHPLLAAPNVLVVPHIGSATHTTRERMADMAVDNVLAGLAGEPLPFSA